MKIKNYIVGSVLFLAMLACVGQSVPTPIDPNNIPTIVVLTANAAMTQTLAAVPTSQPTQTTTPDPFAINGTIEQLPNGSTKYTDAEVGFEVTFPAGWLTLRPNSDEFNSALANEAIKNDLLRKQMELDINDYEPGADRLYSYPLRPDLEKNYLFGFSEIEWDVNAPELIDENSMSQVVRGLETSGAIPGFRSDTAQVYENTGRVKVLEVGGQFSLNDGQGGFLPFYVTVIFFKPTSDTTVRINFTYLKDYKLQIATDVMSVITSVKLLNQ